MTRLFSIFMAVTALISSPALADDYDHNGCCSEASWCDPIRLELSFLYWKVSGDELDYAYDLTDVENNDTTYYRKRFHNVSSDYQPGFKVGLGFDLPCICWDTNLSWTHFDSKNVSHHDVAFRGSVGVSVGIPFVRDSEIGLDGNDYAVARGSLSFKYDVVDLDFGKWICYSDCLLFKPHVGFRAVHIRESFHSSIDQFNSSIQQPPSDQAAHINNEFKGVGLSAGVDADLEICHGLSLVGRVGAALVWGNTKVKNTFTIYESIEANDIGELSKETDHYRHSRAFTDLSLGLRYRTCYCNCPIELEAAWEHHFLFGQHRFFATDTFQSEGGYNFKKDGDVALQGLTISASVDF